MRLRPLRHLALLAAAVALLLPTALASSSDLTFKPGFVTASLHLQGDATGADAAGIRRAIDDAGSGGNNDGAVTAAEVSLFVAKYRAVFEAKAASGVTGGNMTLDGKAPDQVALTAVTLRGAEGLVASEAPITTLMDLNVHLRPSNATTHTLAGKGQPKGQASATMTVRAPPGFAIQTATGLPPEAVFSPGRTAVAFTLGPADRTFLFVPASSLTTTAQGAPAAGATPALLAVLALATVALRRRASPEGQK